ncbi:hypothetical protein [Wenyingzhuangia sp. 2_MG-2023]|uniref:hypothetical protein n=1 Tax=Wenyingzhuangia sp. 2_MG-2023 TaxID=3062639 RepID=UPI0026E40613|nr:hypothetical protein [Wenyingzhuangia sp. 2_MG-2023]MDO6737287.1 hypothetical protein [Wenyingzhuangia sp. 2_MG-2023]MDO6801634.1 hypothetical protein [Wenyingzhuangia sp. 1_MG-2023]
MKYLNKNIEEIGKKTSEKSLVNRSTSCGIFQNHDYNSPAVKNSLQSSKTDKSSENENSINYLFI